MQNSTRIFVTAKQPGTLLLSSLLDGMHEGASFVACLPTGDTLTILGAAASATASPWYVSPRRVVVVIVIARLLRQRTRAHTHV